MQKQEGKPNAIVAEGSDLMRCKSFGDLSAGKPGEKPQLSPIVQLPRNPATPQGSPARMQFGKGVTRGRVRYEVD